MDKRQLRQAVRDNLAGMTEEQRIGKSKCVCRNFVQTEQFRKASVVMVYLSLPHEVDTTGIILYAWQQGKKVVAPKISWEQRHMIPVEINSLKTGFEHGKFGLRNPLTAKPVPVEYIDVVVTPGLAFDRSGNRLGRGCSYYDRFFQNDLLKAARVGFAFEEQVFDAVPAEGHDQQVDFLVTDKGVVECKISS